MSKLNGREKQIQRLLNLEGIRQLGLTLPMANLVLLGSKQAHGFLVQWRQRRPVGEN